MQKEKRLHNSERKGKLFVRADVNDRKGTKNTGVYKMAQFNENLDKSEIRNVELPTDSQVPFPFLCRALQGLRQLLNMAKVC